MCECDKTVLPGGRSLNRDDDVSYYEDGGAHIKEDASSGVGPCLQREVDLPDREEVCNKRC